MRDSKAKEFMVSVRKAEEELQLINQKRRHYIELATNIGVNMSGMPGKPGPSSRVETGAIGLVDLIRDLDEKELEYVEIVKKAEKLIAKLKQENFRKILTLRYMVGCSWKTIMDEMRYKDEKSAYRCHGYALRELQKFM